MTVATPVSHADEAEQTGRDKPALSCLIRQCLSRDAMRWHDHYCGGVVGIVSKSASDTIWNVVPLPP